MAETQSQKGLELGRTITGSQDDSGSSGTSITRWSDSGTNLKSGTGEGRGFVEQESGRANRLLLMPMDIIFEIALCGLTPGDLVALSRTSDALREAMDSPSFSVIWKRAREAAGVPDCPPRLSESQWAALLFGPPVCEKCGATNTHYVELHIQRRVCPRCTRGYLIPTTQFKDLFPDYDAAVLDMVPYTSTRGWASHKYQGNFFWSSDIRRVGAEWERLQDDIKAHVEGAEERAAVYREQRVREVESIEKHASKFRYWAHELGVKGCTRAIERRTARFDEIETRLLALGYDEQDITYTAFYPQSFRKDQNSPTIWARIQPRVVALVESRRDARLEGERNLLRIRRIKMIRELYMEYVESVTPQQWCYLPDIRALIEFPVFKSILEDDSDVSVSPPGLLLAMEQFPTLIQEWNLAKKARVTAMLGPLSGTIDDPLELAVSVFECASNPCFGKSSGWDEIQRFPLISWEAIAAHSCQPASWCLPMGHAPTNVGVSHQGGITAVALVREAGLDPASATIAQMDALDLRFACLECSPSDPWNQQKIGYPWKSAVEHGIEKEHTSWQKMSSKEAEHVKKEENRRNWGLDYWESWSCNHCAGFFNDWDRKDKIVRHLRDVHQIMSPTDPTDLFWYPGKYPGVTSNNFGSIKIEPASNDVANV
ncbi:hypothetical protein BD779DRAFT_1676616 [Infundibulicybe gibba]|nr:hypothetical protein BD779DRAFT_1676616 [Infundibulicybe gibba]